MPGLSQLKQFNKDIQSLGSELTLRASRGEKPVTVPIPKSVEDRNDTEDFVIGMPEIPLIKDNSHVDEDLSDITGLTSANKKSSSKDSEAPVYEAPDMSSLLAPIDLGPAPDTQQDMGMPDLSMFMDNPEPEQEEFVEEEQEEVSVADMGLEALLAGAGFDGSEGTGEEELPTKQEEPEIEEFEEVESINDIPEIPELSGTSKKESENNPTNLPELDVIFGKTPEQPKVDNGSPLDIENFDFGSQPVVENKHEIPDLPDFEAPSDFEPIETFEDNPDVSAISEEDSFMQGYDASILDFDTSAGIEEKESELPEIPASKPDEIPDISFLDEPSADFDTEPVQNFDEVSVPDFGTEPATDFSTEPASDFGSDNFDEIESLEELEDLEGSSEQGSLQPEPFAAPDSSNFSELPDMEEDFTGTPAGLFDAGDLDNPDGNIEEVSDFGSDTDFGSPSDFGSDTDFGAASDFGSDTDFASTDSEPIDFGATDFGAEGLEPLDEGGNLDFGEIPSIDENTDFGSSSEVQDEDFGLPVEDVTGEFNTSPSSSVFSDVSEEIPDFEDAEDLVSEDGSDFEPEQEGPIEVFDTSDMEGMDFGVQETDSQLGAAGPQEADDFGIGEFEIPGFSDVETAKENKKQTKNPKIDVADFSGAVEGDDLPENTLSDEQYKKFLANLSEYPLNVRLAFEDLIVQDEFTDDAEFEIIEKILNKAPARQVASLLEKMLDTSIPVPRDFEHRTAEEYEAYKQSLQYQVKNKILPGFLVGVLTILIGIGLFNFGKHCIVIPIKAQVLYKQGYALLQADEYPQSKHRFDSAAALQLKKKWFFEYARGYREHKQYHMAEDTYKKLLFYFDQDKQAGLEYAEMELDDLANYEKAEEIVRREILDYHVNDQDGILMLGDIFLEWGTEKDPEKLELAKNEYMKLMQLYKPNDLYNSRMMRYFIRTDNIAQVITYQKVFEEKPKALDGKDLTELSGYLLEKLYGKLSPADEPYRYQIEGVRSLLLKAVDKAPDNPIALYNLANYYVQTKDNLYVKPTLTDAIDKFNKAPQIKQRDMYKYIDSYRLLGENYILTNDYLQAQEQYTAGLTLYTDVKENSGFKGNEKIGLLYSDLADINYMIAGDYENAEENYKNAVELGYDNPSIRYRLGYINYKNKNYLEALGLFMKAGEGNVKERNLMLSMANTLSLRMDDYAAEGYYEQLLSSLDDEIANRGGGVFPQADAEENDIVTTYLYASNNYGVTLYRLAKRTGDSNRNAQAIVQFQDSLRAWDSLTRNQKTLERLGGSNLAEQNIQYITHPLSEFEPAIYIEIPKTLTDLERL